MPVHNLPPERSDTQIPQQTVVGKWTNADVSLLTIGRSLNLGDRRPFNDDDEPVRAIPDPWAQARTFGEALLDEKHTIHELVKPQWRGRFAFFGVQQKGGLGQ